MSHHVHNIYVYYMYMYIAHNIYVYCVRPTPTLEAYAPGALGPTLLGYGAGAYAPTPTPEVTTARAPRSRAARLVLQRVSPRSAYQR